MGYDYSRNEEAGNTAWDVWGGVGALTATSVAALPASSEAANAPRRLAAPLWVGALLIILAFLVVYPLLMLVFGAFSDSNPVVDGFGNFKPSVKHFVDVLANENVHLAFFNALAACGGGTILAVAIGLAFSWIVVRTNTPAKGFIAGASMIPLFVPPLVAGVAWGILGSPKTGLLNIALKWLDIDFRFNFYSMSGLIVVFGIYYAPYVYMFTASASPSR
jgi:iron(III) transport system permease protein